MTIRKSRSCRSRGLCTKKRVEKTSALCTIFDLNHVQNPELFSALCTKIHTNLVQNPENRSRITARSGRLQRAEKRFKNKRCVSIASKPLFSHRKRIKAFKRALCCNFFRKLHNLCFKFLIHKWRL